MIFWDFLFSISMYFEEISVFPGFPKVCYFLALPSPVQSQERVSNPKIVAGCLSKVKEEQPTRICLRSLDKNNT